MPTNIKLGPEGGPFVELDEDTGDFIIRVPNDSVDFDLSDLSNISNLIANSAEIDGNTSPYAQDPHDVGGAQHAADTLANLNSKVSDATLDDTNDTREPEAHSGTHESGGTDEVNVAGLPGELADPQPSQTQDDGTDVVASPTLNFTNALNVTDNGGVADVAVDTGALDANIPNWTIDDNSPHNLGTDGDTYTLADSYDAIRVHFYTNTASTDFLHLQINGDTGTNYNISDREGSFSSSQTDMQIAAEQDKVTGMVDMDATWPNACGIYNYIRDRNAVNTHEVCYNPSVSSPLTQFSFINGNGNPVSNDIQIDVYGLNRL